MPINRYHGPQRTSNDIVFYLTASQPSPPLPFELQGAMSPDTWAQRLPVVVQTAGRYSRPTLERIWLIVGFIATIMVPVALYMTIVAKLTASQAARYAEAKAISAAIAVAIALLFLVPLVLLKYMARKHVHVLLTEWAKVDRMKRGFDANAPAWSVKIPGVFSAYTVLTIALPLNPSPSAFHPNAYLPSYLNRPADLDDNYFYPYKPEPGLPRMSVVGKVPLYLDEKHGFHGFHDVKV